ncbi:MAG: type IX secretion system sortase PorU [Bacteroidales bacterium]|nr:type IX secretion system sortase PorU [Bacteroidales bacterium]
MIPKQFLSIFFILSIFGLSAFAQKIETTHVNLKWNSLKSIGEKQNRIKDLSFADAIGSEKYHELPSYFHQIALNENSTITSNISNIQVVEVEDSIIALFPSMMDLDSVFTIETKVYSTRGQATSNIFIETFRLKNNKVEKLISFDLIFETITQAGITPTKGKTYASNSVLEKGEWYKVRIHKNGIYKINGSELNSMGFSLTNLLVDRIKVYGNGGGMLPESNSTFYPDDIVENAIEIYDVNKNGIFEANDYFLFYGQEANVWKYNKTSKRFYHSKHLYDSYAYYFITIDTTGGGKRVQTEPIISQNPTMFANNFTDFAYHNNDSVNLIKSGRTWYGENFNILLSYNFSFGFPNIDPNEQVYFKVNSIARSFTTSTLKFMVNGNSLNSHFSPVINHYLADFAKTSTDNMSFLTSGSTININATYAKPNSNSEAWLNYFELNVVRSLKMVGGQMSFRNTASIGNGNITEFTLSNADNNIKVWDITNITEARIIQSTLVNTKLKIKVQTDSLRQFIAHKNNYLSVKKVEKVKNQNLHILDAVDYVILYHPKFKKEAEELADFHRSRSNMNILTVEPNVIYNEFSSGAKDIGAIRNFMRMLYDKANGDLKLQPKYLLMFGDASYDPKSRLPNNTNFLLTYQSGQSLSPTSSFATDDFFGLLDDNEGANANGSLDIGIGRFPVTTKQQAQDMLNKIYRYTAEPGLGSSSSASCSNGTGGISNLADWRNISCFIGDDEDSNTHLVQADYLANYVWSNYPVYNIDKIFFDAYPQIITPGGQRYPDVKKAIKTRVEKGALIINYTGHGGEEGWAHESVLEVSDINAWNNYNNMPLFVTATCEFSRYDDPKRVSAGELVLLNPNGGGIALLTTSRVTYSSTNFVLSKVVYKNIFEQTNGRYPSLGDVVRISKNGSGNLSANKNFILLGDPALTLSYPKRDIITTAILDANTSTSIDTLKALSKVTIKGEITDKGVLISSFNGLIYPTIYDKTQDYQTLVNDSGSKPYTFKLQKNIIYKGKAQVKNGKFSFTFVVPKDISYKLGDGKISYYAHNGIIDANGYTDTLVIGGSLSNADIDIDGPKVLLFMNDFNFIKGGITDENPSLLASLFDEHGINTVGNGIGHDIVATLDYNSANPIILNEFYESALNDYKRGQIRYPFSKLAIGKHHLSIKVWDVYNNSTTAYTEFIVADGEAMALDHVINAPNPFSEQTSFIFEHNQSCEIMNVEIDIYSSTGQLVKTINTEINTTGYRIGIGQLTWNGRNSNGDKLASGLYIYRLKIQNTKGDWIEKSNKMVILRSH